MVRHHTPKSMVRFAVLATMATVLAAITMVTPAGAATYTNISVQPSDPTAGNASTWTITLDNATGGSVGCLYLYVDTDPAFGSASSAITPTGTPGGSSLFTAGTWDTGPTAVGGTSAYEWLSSGGETSASGSGLSFTVETTNPVAGSYYVNVETFADAGCSTPIDSGTSAVAITTATTVSVDLQPTFTFTVANQASACNGESDFVSGAGTATSVALGHLAAGTNVSGGQALSISGNAGNGFVVYVQGTQASQNLRNASHNWTDVSGSYGSPAVLGAGEEFGYTYNDATTSSSVTNPSSADFIALTNTNNAVMGSTSSETGSSCISYDAQTAADTPAGTYNATAVYTAVPTF